MPTPHQTNPNKIIRLDGITSQPYSRIRVRETAQAYSEAYAAGYTEAADKMDDMFAAFVRRQARTVDPTLSETPITPEEECTYVRDSSSPDDVLRDADIIRLSQHAAHCVPCLRVLIAQAVEAGLSSLRCN